MIKILRRFADLSWIDIKGDGTILFVRNFEKGIIDYLEIRKIIGEAPSIQKTKEDTFCFIQFQGVAEAAHAFDLLKKNNYFARFAERRRFK